MVPKKWANAVRHGVLANDKASGETRAYAVTATIAHLDPTITHLTLDGELLETTPEHPFYTVERGG